MKINMLFFFLMMILWSFPCPTTASAAPPIGWKKSTIEISTQAGTMLVSLSGENGNLQTLEILKGTHVLSLPISELPELNNISSCSGIQTKIQYTEENSPSQQALELHIDVSSEHQKKTLWVSINLYPFQFSGAQLWSIEEKGTHIQNITFPTGTKLPKNQQ